MIEHPILVGEKKIEIKKATVLNTAGNNKTKKKEYDEDGNEIKDDVLIEIRHKTFVVLESKFRAIITQEKEGGKRKVDFIEFKDALDYRNLKTDFIQAEIKIPNKIIPTSHELLFTLSKNDLVVLPDTRDESIDWNNVLSFSNKLYRVLDFDSTGFIRFERHTTAFPIELKDNMNATGLSNELNKRHEKLKEEEEIQTTGKLQFETLSKDHTVWKKNLSKEDLKFHKKTMQEKNAELKSERILLKEHQKEIDGIKKEIKNLTYKIAFGSKEDKNGNEKEANPIEEQTARKNKEDIQKVIKVFTDKLGKKIVPYWQFENGCWNKNRAEELGLI